MPSKYGTGTKSMEQAAERTSFGDRVVYLSTLMPKDGDVVRVRFLDDWEEATDANDRPLFPHLGAFIHVDQHGSVPTRKRPDWLDEKAKWYDHMGSVCRNTLLPGGQRLFQTLPDADEGACIPCTMKQVGGKNDGKPYFASARGWCRAVIREEVRDDQGRRRGFRDATREVERDGEKVIERAYVVANMGVNNFFNYLKNFGEAYGTVLDRDYKITRIGEKLKTDYGIVPMDPMPAPNVCKVCAMGVVQEGDNWVHRQEPDEPHEVVHYKSADFDHFDLRDPVYFRRYSDCPYDLEKVVDEQASYRLQRRWFDPTYTPPKRDDDDEGGNGAPESQQAKPEADVESEAKLAKMRSRVTSYGGPDESTQSEPEPERQPEPVSSGGGLEDLD